MSLSVESLPMDQQDQAKDLLQNPETHSPSVVKNGDHLGSDRNLPASRLAGEVSPQELQENPYSRLVTAHFEALKRLPKEAQERYLGKLRFVDRSR